MAKHASLINPVAYLSVSRLWSALRGEVKHLTAGDILRARDPEHRTIFSCGRADSAHSALQAMLENRVRVLVVEDEGGVCGILTDTDFLQKVAVELRDPTRVSCVDIMTPLDRCTYVNMDNDVDSCMAIMAEVQSHHVPVLQGSPEDGVLEGVLSLEECLRATQDRREAEEAHLTQRVLRFLRAPSGRASVTLPKGGAPER